MIADIRAFLATARLPQLARTGILGEDLRRANIMRALVVSGSVPLLAWLDEPDPVPLNIGPNTTRADYDVLTARWDEDLARRAEVSSPPRGVGEDLKRRAKP